MFRVTTSTTIIRSDRRQVSSTTTANMPGDPRHNKLIICHRTIRKNYSHFDSLTRTTRDTIVLIKLPKLMLCVLWVRMYIS